MNYTIQAIEDALKAKVTAEVAYLPAVRLQTVAPELDVPTLTNQMLPNMPLVLVGFEGFDSPETEETRWDDGLVWHENYLWVLFLVTKSFRSSEQMIRGDDTVKGAYDLMVDVTAALNGEVLLAGMNPVHITSAKLVKKQTNLVVYRLDLVTGQDRSKDLSACGT